MPEGHIVNFVPDLSPLGQIAGTVDLPNHEVCIRWVYSGLRSKVGSS